MPSKTSGWLGVGLVGTGWVAASHVRAFQANPHARLLAMCGRQEARARAKLTRFGADVAGVTFTRTFQDLLDRPRHRHYCHRHPESPSRRASGGGGAGRKTLPAREADRSRPPGADPDPTGGPGRQGADDRVIRPALQPVHQVRALDACVRAARGDPLRPLSVSVENPGGLSRMGVGEAERQRAQPSAGGRLPRGRRVAVVLRARADRGLGVPHQVHEGLSVADVDRCQPEARPQGAGAGRQLDRLHDALHVRCRDDG